MNDVAQFLAALEARGLTVRPTRRGHWRVTTRGGRYLTTVPGTPSDRRALKNAKADVRRGLRKRAGRGAS